ncbi:hypothetical protein DRQ07_06495 [candidate division KSB1 bacterium]|nr:hypothetical protein [bacterium]RKY79356.1 MAG: hypothetical protein DRQ07_06495 [candidate division KSB1 bacterium]
MSDTEQRVRVELLLASPPTSKGKKILEMIEQIINKFPDKIRVDIYYAGETPDVSPSAGYQSAGKFKKIPSIFINSSKFWEREVPEYEELENAVKQCMA